MLVLSGVSKRYGDIRAVDNLSFSVTKGQIVGLLGLNGSGKSTTFKLIAGLLRADEGSIRINGLDLATQAKEYRKAFAYLPEIPPLYEDLTVLEYLKHVASLKKLSGIAAETNRVLEATGLGSVQKRLIRVLSKGYHQRVGIAQAMLGSPELLLLDEPSVGLDPSQNVEIRSLIRSLGRDHTVIFSSHILSEAAMVCDRVLLIRQGRLIADESPECLSVPSAAARHFRLLIQGRPQLAVPILENIEGVSAVSIEKKEIHFSAANEEAQIRVFYALAERSIPVLELSRRRSSLEDAFLSLMSEEVQS